MQRRLPGCRRKWCSKAASRKLPLGRVILGCSCLRQQRHCQLLIARSYCALQGIHFRFMPDMHQVKHALSLYQEAGVPTKSFVGVPVFQAEGLTVTTQDTVSGLCCDCCSV